MARKKKIPKLDDAVTAPRMGVMSNLFESGPKESAETIAGYALETVLLLPSFPDGLRVRTAEDVTAKTAKAMSGPFLDRELDIPAVVAQHNAVDPDEDRRDRTAARLRAIVDHLDDFGSRCVLTESGTLDAERPWDDDPANHTPETFERWVESMRPLVEHAAAADATILVQPYLYHVIDGIDAMKAAREALGEHLGFAMDPANVFSRGMANSSSRSLTKLFREVAGLCPLVLAKDVRYEKGVLTTPRVSLGLLDYHHLLQLIDEHMPECPLILQQIQPTHLRESIDYIDQFFPTAEEA